MKKKKKKNKVIIVVIFFAIFAIVIGILAIQRVDDSDILIEGNEKYTDEEIIDFIFNSKWDKNPFAIFYETKYGNQKTIPFVDKYDVKITSFHSIKITVYEKKIIGYVTYMGSNMYFDKDGTVVESSTKVLEGIPKITGLTFDSIVLYEYLPVGDKEVFNLILDTTQILQKYEIAVDKIYISNNKQVSLFIQNIKVELGTNKDLNDKIRTLNDILPNLSGLSGTLDIKEYSDSDSGYTFKKNS